MARSTDRPAFRPYLLAIPCPPGRLDGGCCEITSQLDIAWLCKVRAGDMSRASQYDRGVPAVAPTLVEERLTALDWEDIERSLWAWGYARTPALLTPAQCAELIALYPDETRFRSRIDMERYRFGVGDYKYFGHPLHPLVAELRTRLYPALAGVANRWEQALGTRLRYPLELE